MKPSKEVPDREQMLYAGIFKKKNSIEILLVFKWLSP